eukprot:6615622-Prymnesium_polylepis.1
MVVRHVVTISNLCPSRAVTSRSRLVTSQKVTVWRARPHTPLQAPPSVPTAPGGDIQGCCRRDGQAIIRSGPA